MSIVEKNIERHKFIEKCKKSYGTDIYRATGRTSRLLCEIASYEPYGEFVYIAQNSAMARYAFDRFVRLQDSLYAPMRINENEMCVIVRKARYIFRADSKVLRQRIRPSARVFEDLA